MTGVVPKADMASATRSQSKCRNLVLCHAFIDGLCATGFASAPNLQEALAKPVAHIKTRLADHQD